MIYTKRLEKAALIARVAHPCVLRRTSSQFGAKIQMAKLPHYVQNKTFWRQI